MALPVKVGPLQAQNNLSDVSDPSAALVNLGGIPITGGQLEGPLLLAIGEPTEPQSATPKTYVDAEVAEAQLTADNALAIANAALPLVGGVTMAGLFGLAGAPVEGAQPTTKTYVDTADGVIANSAATAVSTADAAKATADVAKATADAALAAATGGPIVSVGNWNASTNSPTVTSSNGSAVGGVAGRGFTISVAGTTNINGEAVWEVGDAIVWGGSVWYRVAYSGVYAMVDGATMTNLTASGPLADFDVFAIGGDGGTMQAADLRYGLLGGSLVQDKNGAIISFVSNDRTNMGNLAITGLSGFNTTTIPVALTLELDASGAVQVGTGTIKQIDPRYALLGSDLTQDANGAIMDFYSLTGIRQFSDVSLTSIAVPGAGIAHFRGSLDFVEDQTGIIVGAGRIQTADPRYALLGADLIFDSAGAIISLTEPGGRRVQTTMALQSLELTEFPTNPTSAVTREFVENLSSNPYLEPKRDFGAVGDGIADDSIPVNECIDASLVRGIMACDFPYNVPTLTNQSGGVICIGPGVFINSPSPRLVVPTRANPPYVQPATARLRNQCPNASAAARDTGIVRVGFTGDSVATNGVNTYSYFETFAAAIHGAFLRDNPSLTVPWFPRAIGGGNWAQLNSFPVGSPPSWYTDPELPWIHYLEILELDLLIVSCGRNGSGQIKWEDIREFRAKMALWSKPCDLVVTNSVGETLEAIVGAVNALTTTENYEYAAGVIRSYALTHGVPLVDSETTQSSARWGFNQEYLPMLHDQEAFGLVGATGATACVMPFQMALPVYGYGAYMRTRADGWTRLGNELIFELGQAKTDEMRGSKFFLRRDPGTFEISYEVTVTRIVDGASTDWTFIPETPTGVFIDDDTLMSFAFYLQGSRLQFDFVGQNPPTPPLFAYIPKAGGPWQPTISCAAGSVSNGVDFLPDPDNSVRVSACRPRPEVLTMPTINDTEFASPADAPLLPWNGGGPHPSSLAVQRIILPAVSINDFSL